MLKASEGDNRRWFAGGLAVIVLATLIAYLPAINAGYIWDDDAYLTDNRPVQNIDGLPRLWRPGQTPQYYPLVFTTFWIEHKLWGLDPLGYHLVNVLLHIANALLLCRIMRLLGVPGAWMIGAIFALHPVHVESVAWITERKNLLSGFFYLLAALSWFRFDPLHGDGAGNAAETGAGRRWGWYALSLVLFVAALLSKTVTCSLPAALILVMIFRRQRLTARRLLPLAPMFAVGAALALHTAHLERASVGAIGELFDQSFLERLLVAGRALLFYPWKLLVPRELMFVYPRWAIDPSAPAAWWPIPVIALVTVGAVLAFIKGRRGPSVALAFFAGTIFPALGFFNVYPHRYSFVADHFQYLASIGIIAMVVAFVMQALRSVRQRFGLAAIVLSVLGVITFVQAGTYKSAETVWRDTLSKNDESWPAHNNLADFLLERIQSLAEAGRYDEMEALVAEAHHHALRTVQIRPEAHHGHANLAETLRLQGRHAEALASQQTALELVTRRYERAGEALPAIHGWDFFQLGRLHLALAHFDEAAAAFRRAAAMQPDNFVMIREAVDLLAQAEQWSAAADLQGRLVALEPSNPYCMSELAALCERGGDFGAADRHYRSAVVAAGRRMPECLAATAGLAQFLMTCPDPARRAPEEAIELIEQLVAYSNRKDASSLRLLGFALAEVGRLDAAIATAEEALAVARRMSLEDIAGEIEADLERYRRSRPEESGPQRPPPP